MWEKIDDFLRFVRFVLFFPVGVEDRPANNRSGYSQKYKKNSEFIHYTPLPSSIRYPQIVKIINTIILHINVNKENRSGETNLPIISPVKIICAKLKKNFAKFSFLRFVSFIDIITLLKKFVNSVIINIIQNFYEFFVNIKKSGNIILKKGRAIAVFLGIIFSIVSTGICQEMI